jgi:hypothetical protein
MFLPPLTKNTGDALLEALAARLLAGSYMIYLQRAQYSGDWLACCEASHAWIEFI